MRLSRPTNKLQPIAPSTPISSPALSPHSDNNASSDSIGNQNNTNKSPSVVPAKAHKRLWRLRLTPSKQPPTDTSETINSPLSSPMILFAKFNETATASTENAAKQPSLATASTAAQNPLTEEPATQPYMGVVKTHTTIEHIEPQVQPKPTPTNLVSEKDTTDNNTNTADSNDNPQTTPDAAVEAPKTTPPPTTTTTNPVQGLSTENTPTTEVVTPTTTENTPTTTENAQTTSTEMPTNPTTTETLTSPEGSTEPTTTTTDVVPPTEVPENSPPPPKTTAKPEKNSTKDQEQTLSAHEQRMQRLSQAIKRASKVNEDNLPVRVTEDGVYIGSFAAAKNTKVLLKEGITHIVCVAKNLKVPQPTEDLLKEFDNGQRLRRFEVLHVDVDDFPSEDLRPHFARCVEFMRRGLKRADNNGTQQPKAGGVLVHCFAGLSRSAAVVVAFLMLDGRVPPLKSLEVNPSGGEGEGPFLQAMEIVRKVRPKMRPNEGFMEQLKQLERDLLDGQTV